MSENIQEPTLENQQLSEEEIQEKKEVIKAFYEEEIPFLKLRAEYEELVTRIETARFDRTVQSLQMAQMMAPPPEMQEQMREQMEEKNPPNFKTDTQKTPKTSKPKGKRTLKKA